ncbi:MAG TPA: winged helix-turn-helix domain-containing protein [Aliidongia sp.]|nr:winged helix-turn-helix domain-containing protein [Aliidongia sp.]
MPILRSATPTLMVHDPKWEADDVISFGPFRLFPVNRLLEKGGVPVPLGDRAFDVLLLLIEHAAEIVSKATLLARVWPDVTVDEGSLRVQMASLRKSLGDGEAGVRYVSTVQGRGYRFVALIIRSKTSKPLHQAFLDGPARIPRGRPARMAGRSGAVRKVSALLSVHRFVTLVGPGGIGKSAVARAVASELEASYAQGVRFIDLASLADAALVPAALAKAVGSTVAATESIPGLIAYLGDKRMLLVLDNCEPVRAAAAAAAASIVKGTVGIAILATSREPLRAEGEHRHRLTSEIELAPQAASEPAKPGTNLPQPLDALIGRADELVDLQESIALHRLVTVVGSGGIGKTRLAIELGWLAAGEFPDGVWLIDLAPVADPAVVPSATATVLGVALRDADTPVEAIAAAIGKQRKLLIFDNCEHLLGAAARLIEGLLERVPGLSVLATSQENLHAPTEQIYRLNPLALPPVGTDDIAGFGAVALFVERAAAADRRFILDAGNAPGVAEICRRLDGIPLALEMAAARLPLLGIEGLRARLDERLRMLTTGPHTVESRHRTLRNMVEWSHALLDVADQRVFRRLAIFSGSFSLDAAIAVASDGADQWDVIDALGRLIDKSMVTVEAGEQPRYRLLETLRLYALEQLKASAELDATAARHARHFIELFDRSDALWETVPEAQWLVAYRPETDNVRGAADWALAAPERAPLAIHLIGTASLLWQTLALFAEGRRYVERAAALVDQATAPAAAARLFRGAGSLWYNSDRLRAIAWQERSVALYRRIGNRLDLATVLSSIGSLYASLGRNAEARVTLAEAETLLSGSDRKRSLFNVMNNLGTLAGLMNEIDEARHNFVRALDLARALKDAVRENYVLMNLAEMEFVLGSIDRAIDRGREAVDGLRSAGRRSFLELALINLGSYLIFRGDLAEARSVAEEALATASEEGGFVVRVCLQQWALLGALDGRHREAARLIGFVDAGYAASGDIRSPSMQRIRDELRRLLEKALPEADIGGSAAEGAGWGEAQAVAFALDRLISRRQSSPI